MYFGAVEAGGTKFVCAIGNENGDVLVTKRITTEDPKKTIAAVIDFFNHYKLYALGIASFGPIDVNKESPSYGYITSTPKQGWRGFPFVRTMEEALNVPVGFNTDVNGAALGETVYGAAKGRAGCLYVTVGTGIGAGAVVKNSLLQGLSHPEMGHLLVRRHPGDSFAGICPYHKDCLEGLASGTAIEARWGKKASELAGQKKVWEMEAYYLAQALMQYILILSPEKIIMGGGVMKQEQLFPLIRRKLQELLAGYVVLPETGEGIDDYIVPPALGNHSGITGAFILAKQAAGVK